LHARIVSCLFSAQITLGSSGDNEFRNVRVSSFRRPRQLAVKRNWGYTYQKTETEMESKYEICKIFWPKKDLCRYFKK